MQLSAATRTEQAGGVAPPTTHEPPLISLRSEPLTRVMHHQHGRSFADMQARPHPRTADSVAVHLRGCLAVGRWPAVLPGRPVRIRYAIGAIAGDLL